MAASRPRSDPVLVVVMGVAGCGKSTVGQALAEILGGAFLEGDNIHPRPNIDKMSTGVPLDDADRAPWLTAIGSELGRLRAQGRPAVAACSALRRRYRDNLRTAAGSDITFVYLEGTRDLIAARMSQRTGHFMPASLLASQFAALEPPDPEETSVRADLARPVEALISDVIAAFALQLRPGR